MIDKQYMQLIHNQFCNPCKPCNEDNRSFDIINIVVFYSHLIYVHQCYLFIFPYCYCVIHSKLIIVKEKKNNKNIVLCPMICRPPFDFVLVLSIVIVLIYLYHLILYIFSSVQSWTYTLQHTKRNVSYFSFFFFNNILLILRI